MIYIIYKTIYDNNGAIEKVDLVECDTHETSVVSFTKLYNLQVPKDLKHRVQYAYVATRVI